jgi:hypothetical protein
MPKFTVIVSNIGTVYTGSDSKVAESDYAAYVSASRGNIGNAAGETVTLLKDGEPVKDYIGTLAQAGTD